MRSATLVSTICWSCLLLSVAACADKPALEGSAKNDADYSLQGEYSGDTQSGQGTNKMGCQVIALGDGKFQAVTYAGGLPGDGWNQRDRQKAEGQAAGGKVRFDFPQSKGELSHDVLTLLDSAGQEIGRLKKVERRSPTLGAKPPQGAVVLFDGVSADAFEKGKVEAELLAGGVTSKQKFTDFRLHLEFRTPFQPAARGQGRGNSGCYLQGRYEVQILDSFGLEGKNNECGGIYETREPDLNMCFPPLSWQTYDIDYTAAHYDSSGKKTSPARVTVKHNGVLVHDDVELPKATRAHPVPEGPGPGPIYLQDHGNPVRFRNIWLVEK